MSSNALHTCMGRFLRMVQNISMLKVFLSLALVTSANSC